MGEREYRRRHLRTCSAGPEKYRLTTILISENLIRGHCGQLISSQCACPMWAPAHQVIKWCVQTPWGFLVKKQALPRDAIILVALLKSPDFRHTWINSPLICINEVDFPKSIPPEHSQRLGFNDLLQYILSSFVLLFTSTSSYGLRAKILLRGKRTILVELTRQGAMFVEHSHSQRKVVYQ